MSSSSGQSSKRRAQIACTNCRDRKVKCEHENEEPCSRCAASGKECHYEPVNPDRPASSQSFPSPPLGHLPTSDGGFLLEGVRGPSFPAQNVPYSHPPVPVQSQHVPTQSSHYPPYQQMQAPAHRPTHPSQYPQANGFIQPQMSSPVITGQAQNSFMTPVPGQTWPQSQSQYQYTYTSSSATYQGHPQNWPDNSQVAGGQYSQTFNMQPHNYNPQHPENGGR